MADSVIGALRVLLGIDTVAFSSGLKDADKALNLFGSNFSSLAKKLSIAATASAFVYDIKKMINEADNLNKASQKFGVPVEQLSALKYAADLADVSFESLGKGLGKLSKAMLESAANPAGEAAKNFQALGVSVTDSSGNIKSTETVFTDIAEKFSTMEDGAAKTALAIKVFGRAGADLIPLLNAGRSGIKALTDEARQLGIVISAETARKAEEFNDTLKKVHTAVDAIALRAAEALLPSLQRIADAMLSGAKEGSSLQGIINNLITQKDIDEARYYVTVMENLIRIFSALKAFPGNVISEGITAALKKLDDVVIQNQKNLEAYARSLLSLGQAGAFESLENLPALMDRVAKGMTNANVGALAAKSAIDSFIDSQMKSIAAHQAEAEAIGMGLGVRERLKIYYEAEAIARANNITLTDQQKMKLNELALAAENAAIKIAGAQMKQEALTPWDLYLQKLRDINTVLERHPELAEAARVASMKAAAQMAESYGQTAATAMGNFATFFKEFGKGNKAMFIAAKAFSVSQAIINTFVGVTKALAEGGPVLGPILAASIVAAGMAAVAKIIAEKPPAMALGGTLQLGGSGGVDSQMVPVMMTPGERLTVDQNKYGESSSAGKTITIAGIKPKDYYTGDVLRDIMDNINSAIGDGYKIKMA